MDGSGGHRHPSQERELDKLRKTIEEYRIKSERCASNGGVFLSSSHEPLRVTSPLCEASLSPEVSPRVPCSNYSASIIAARRQSAVGAADRDKRVSSGSLSSMSSHASHSSVSSSSSATSMEGDMKNNKRKRWQLPIKSAFSRSTKSSQSSGIHECDNTDDVYYISPTQSTHTNFCTTQSLEQATSVDVQAYNEMLQLVQEKERKLTDVKLDALMSQHQLHQLQDQVEQMQHEMHLLRMENERLQACSETKEISMTRKFSDRDHSPIFTSAASSVSSFGLHLSPMTTPNEGSPIPRISSMNESNLIPNNVIKHMHLDSNKFRSLVSFDSNGSSIRFVISSPNSKKTQKSSAPITLNSLGGYQQRRENSTVIGSLPVARNITWDELDRMTCNIFTEYCLCVDGESRLGLSSSSIAFYQVGEQTRMPGTQPPQLLPCAFIVGNVDSINISLKDGASAALDLLSFKTLIPKNVVQRYVLNLLQKKQIMLYGPTGSGKTFLAKSFAQFLLNRARKSLTFDDAVFIYDVKASGEKGLCDYIKDLAERYRQIANSSHSKLDSIPPTVLIVENCPTKSRMLNDIFLPLTELGDTGPKPFVICTSLQSKIENTNNLSNNFSWISCLNTSPHAKDFLARFLRRSAIENEIFSRSCAEEADFQNILRIVTWLPLCWHHINRSLENYQMQDATIAPHVFTSCPLQFTSSCHWFIKTWNSIIVPFVSAALRRFMSSNKEKYEENITKWVDPTSWVIKNFPWNSSEMGKDFSLRLKTISCSNDGPPVPPKDMTLSPRDELFNISTQKSLSPPPIPPRPEPSDNRRYSQACQRSTMTRLKNGEVVTEISLECNDMKETPVWQRHSALTARKSDIVNSNNVNIR